jgi:hypothetical protein
MIETILFSMVMVPFLVFTVWLGNLADLRLQTGEAARQLAFECTVRTPECLGTADAQGLNQGVRIRSFANVTGPVDGRGEIRGALVDQPDLGGHRDRRGTGLLSRYEDVVMRVEPSRFDAGLSQALGQAGRSMANAAETLSKVSGPDHFGLALTSGLFVAKVDTMTAARSTSSSVAASNVGFSANSPARWVGGGWREGLDPWPVRLQARAAILTDPWAASMPTGPDVQSVEQRLTSAWRVPSIGGLPSDALLSAWSRPVQLFLKGADALGLEPSADQFRYHQIEWDRVPADRLGAAVVRP